MKEGQAPIWTLRKNIPGVSSTWHDYQVDQVIEDLIHHVLQVHDKPATEEEVSGERERQVRGGCAREFPYCDFERG